MRSRLREVDTKPNERKAAKAAKKLETPHYQYQKHNQVFDSAEPNVSNHASMTAFLAALRDEQAKGVYYSIQNPKSFRRVAKINRSQHKTIFCQSVRYYTRKLVDPTKAE